MYVYIRNRHGDAHRLLAYKKDPGDLLTPTWMLKKRINHSPPSEL